jgi:ATP-dependent Lhr-like helicase
VSPFDQLHPALQHHIVNTLGWPSLRPLQEQAIAPLLNGEHALLLAPTAGGKTEAAIFPLFSRMLGENWSGLTLLYVCPLRALLNNLAVRLEHYGRLIGRDVALWHGDVPDSARRRIINEPPDCLLITPESLEVILITRRRDKDRFFRKLQAVVVDEIHAFAGDDRGWHLLAILERLTRLAGRELQRVGLSATVGKPEALLDWLVGRSEGRRHVIAPTGWEASEADVTLDYVGDLENAATVISRLHHGDKRLVFCDSRDRVEQLAAELRSRDVDTHVSHSSLGREERRRAEAAFTEGTNCVIVATSTLELGIDIGDLDHVIQIDAPRTVAGFLQRLGRSGRRPGATRNCLFLATTDEALVRAAALVMLWREGYVEPIVPPPQPFHILAQQLMALALQEGGVGSQSWWSWVATMPAFAAMSRQDIEAVARYMLDTDILWNDSGVLWLADRGEKAFGRKNFMELFSSFTSDPLIAVRHGRTHLGEVDAATFAMRHEEVPVLLLAGRSWAATHIDWQERIAYVVPVQERGRSRWLGSGQPLGYALCQAIRRVLAGSTPNVNISKRSTAKLAEIRQDFDWVDPHRTTVVRQPAGSFLWWTFGGLGANAALAGHLRNFGIPAADPDNLAIPIRDGTDGQKLEEAIRHLGDDDPGQMAAPVNTNAIHELKFSTCVPLTIATRMLAERLTDRPAIRAVLAEPVTYLTSF